MIGFVSPPERLGSHVVGGILAVAVFVALWLLMYVGWRHRARRDGELPELARPDDASGILEGPLPGLYVGTTAAGAWLERVVALGLSRRGAGVLMLTEQGLRVDRDGEAAFVIPRVAVIGARVDTAQAGKVVAGPAGGLLVVTWRHGGRELDTGFRADDKGAHPEWARLLSAAADPALADHDERRHPEADLDDFRHDRREAGAGVETQ